MKKILIQPTIDKFDSFLEFAKQNGLGFEIVDFAFPNVLDSMYQPIIEKYKSVQDSHPNLIVSQHGAFLDLCVNSRDSLIREASIKRIIQNLEISNVLNLNYTVFHSNYIPLIGQRSYSENWIKKHVDFWTSITKRYNTTMVIENLWDPTPDHLFDLVNQVGSDKLRLCFDTGHHNVFSQASLKEWFSKLGKYIAYIHMNDNKGDFDSELPVGDGNINWNEFNELVNEYCETPIAVLEVGDLDNISKSINYLEKNKVYPYN